MKDKIMQSRLKKAALKKNPFQPLPESELYKAAKERFKMFHEAKIVLAKKNSCEN